jgi:hypothetical protein
MEILQLPAPTSLLSGEYPATELFQPSQSQSHIATDGQSVSLGVEPHLGLMTRYLLLFNSYGIVFLLGALSDSPSIVAIGGCLAIARISLTCLPAVTKQRMFLLAIVA